MTTFAVITEVSPPETGLNMAAPIGELYISTNGLECRRVGGIEQMAFRTPVFTPGEILILDEDGRELAGRYRKPSKWGVSYETYINVEAAIDRARDVLHTVDGVGQQLEEDL